MSQSQPASRSHSPKPAGMSAMTVLVLSFLVIVVLIALIVVLVPLLTSQSPREVLEPLVASVERDDGSLLIIKEVTLGTDHHVVHPFPNPDFDIFTAGMDQADMQIGQSDDQIGIWFEQYSQPDFRPDDFSWWQRTTILDEAGNEIDAVHTARFSRGLTSSSMSSGSQPYDPLDPEMNPEVVAALALFPYFRHSGNTVTVRIYSAATDPVAEFEIPNPMLGKSFPNWTAAEFPISQTLDGVTITLNGVTRIRHVGEIRNGREVWSDYLNIDSTVTIDGKEFREETRGPIRVADAMGNDSFAGNIKLPEGEKVWKLTVPWRRKAMAVTDPKLIHEIELPTLPEESDTAVPVKKSISDFGTKVTLLQLGRGKKEFDDLIATTTVRTSSRAGMFEKEHYQLKYENEYSRFSSGPATYSSTMEVDFPGFWIVGQIEQPPGSQSVVDLVLLDVAGNEIPSKSETIEGLTIWFFPAKEYAQPITARIVIQEPLQFEFLIEKPEVTNDK